MTQLARSGAFIFLLGFSLWACTQQALLSPTQFSEIYIEAFRAHAPQVAITSAGPLHLEVTAGESGSTTVYLDNAYARYRADHHAADEIIDDYVTGMLEFIEQNGRPIDVSRVVPVIKDAGYLADIRASTGADLSMAHEAYNALLEIHYAEDLPRNIRYLSEQGLQEAGLAPAERRARSIENLRALLPKVEVHGGKGVYLVTAGGAYEASLLLLDDLWQNPALQVAGEIVVAIPARDTLLVTGSEDDQGLEFVRRQAADVSKQSAYYLTKQLFIFRRGRFVPFEG